VARKKSLKVERVDRQLVPGGKFVFQVVIVYDERVRLNFVPDFSRFNLGGFCSQGRSQMESSQSAEAKRLGISRRGYARIMRVVAAIFAENKRDANGQKIKGG